jgi:hypothetical protein
MLASGVLQERGTGLKFAIADPAHVLVLYRYVVSSSSLRDYENEHTILKTCASKALRLPKEFRAQWLHLILSMSIM